MLMPLAAIVLGAAYLGLIGMGAPDPDAGARSRARVLAALSGGAPSPAARIPPSPMLGPPVLAQRPPRAPLPSLLTLPADVAASVPLSAPDARRELHFAVSEDSRPLVYRLEDG